MGTSLARTPEALWSATVFSLLALTLHRALGIHEEKAQAHMDQHEERLGVLRYRRQMELDNRDKVIATTADRYGIFPLREFANILVGSPMF